MKRMLFVLILSTALVGALFAAGQSEAASADGDEPIRIAMVVKSLGNSAFEAMREGALEAADEIGGIELIYQGPSTPTAEGQIEIIDSLIAQRVDAIAISANDVDALVPIARTAMRAGIKVITFDSGIAEEGRILHISPLGDELTGRSQMRLLAEMIDFEGEVAILSATSQATNQNAWIRWMREEIDEPEYSDMELVSVVYGDDLSDKSYREAVGLFQSYPDLKGIIAPTTVGIAATAKALEDQGLDGEIVLTGLGLPSEMKQYIHNGTVEKMALYNPVDLGYTFVQVAHALVTEEATGEVDEVISVGRMGEITVGEEGVAVMGEPFVFDESNVDQFASIF